LKTSILRKNIKKTEKKIWINKILCLIFAPLYEKANVGIKLANSYIIRRLRFGARFFDNIEDVP
jgi:hypothetical protein